MKKLLAAYLTLGVIAMSVPAFAADMPLKAPPPPPAPMWTGWYVGGNIGGSFGTAHDTALFPPTPVPGTAFGSTSADLDGIIGGGQVGYNMQNGNWVWGIEADIQGSSESSSASYTGTGFVGGVALTPVTGVLTDNEKLAWFGTLRGRLGVTVTPNWLLYGTGGLAYGQIDSNTTLAAGGPPLANNFTTDRAGWTAGAGIEGWLGRDWTAKLEYLYVDFGSFTDSFTGIGAFTPVTLTTHVTDNIVRIGLNYHFH